MYCKFHLTHLQYSHSAENSMSPYGALINTGVPGRAYIGHRKSVPETAILPSLAQTLDCSIDSLLSPRELFVLESVYTDGQTDIPVTHFVDNMVCGNALNIYVNTPFVRASLDTLVNSFHAGECCGYHQGEDACRAWMEGLARDSDLQRIAASYLRESVALVPEKCACPGGRKCPACRIDTGYVRNMGF